MVRISAAVAFIALIGTANFVIPAAAADAWGCSYDKCLAVCAKASGKYCSAYCDKQLKEKQASKVCK